MTTVAETYLRVDEFRPNEDNVMHVAEVVGRATHIIALELYPETAEVEIRLEPGSLKVWARVTAAAGLIYGGVATYPDFKSGLHELTNDARSFGTFVINQFKKEVTKDVFALRRTMTPGRLLRNLNQLELLEDDTSKFTSHEREKEITNIRWGLEYALSDLTKEGADRVKEIIREHHLPLLPPAEGSRLFTRNPDPPTLNELIWGRRLESGNSDPLYNIRFKVGDTTFLLPDLRNKE